MIKNSFKTIKGQMLSGFSILVILLLFYFFVNHEYRNEEIYNCQYQNQLMTCYQYEEMKKIS